MFTLIFLHCSIESGTLCHTVEPVYKDHPEDKEYVVSVDRWSSYNRDVSETVVLVIIHWILYARKSL